MVLVSLLKYRKKLNYLNKSVEISSTQICIENDIVLR